MTPDEKNEYDHKVIYNDLFDRIRKVKLSSEADHSLITALGERIDNLSYNNLKDLPETIELGHTLTLTAKKAGVGGIDRMTEFTGAEDREFEVPVATKDSTGLVRVGSNININDDGTISVTFPSSVQGIRLGAEQQGNSNVFITTVDVNGKAVLPIGLGSNLKCDSGVLDTVRTIYTSDPGTAAKDGDILLLPAASGTVSTIPLNAEGRYLYTGPLDGTMSGTYMIKSEKYGTYYLQSAVSVTDPSVTLRRVSNGSSATSWKYAYALWA